MCNHLAGEREEDKINALYHICRALKTLKSAGFDDQSRVKCCKASGNPRSFFFGLGKGQELMKEGQLYTLCLALADELEGECEKRKANKCLRIILDPEVLEDAHLAENQFTVVLVSAKEKIAVEKLEEFSASSFASFKSVPGKRPTQQ